MKGVMRFRLFPLLVTLYLIFSAHLSTSAQEASTRRRKQSTLTSSEKIGIEQQKAAERALARLRVLRDGWNDVNRQFIKNDFVAARKRDPHLYEVQYLEAKKAVGDTLQILPQGELRTAIEQAMDLFDDLEMITGIFDKSSPLTTDIRVADIFPYLKKYNIPYESAVMRKSYGLTLYQDFVMSYILPIRYARVNRVEVLLGGEIKPVPPPPTYQQMFRVPPVPVQPNVSAEELKEIARKAIEARLHGDKSGLSVLLDGSFTFQALRGSELNKEQYLIKVIADPTVKSFEIEPADLIIYQAVPRLETRVKYQSFTNELRSYQNVFTFVLRNGQWLIAKWRSY